MESAYRLESKVEEIISVAFLLMAIFLHAISKIYIYKKVITPDFLHLAIAIFYFSFSIYHAICSLGKKAIVFFLLTVSGGFLFEFIKTYSGFMTYSNEFGVKVFELIPVIIPFWFFLLAYISYSMTNLLINGAVSTCSSFERKGVFDILSYSIVDSFVATGFLLMAAPIDTYQKQWIWKEAGEYFGVPISAYLFWQVYTIPVFFIFRFYSSLYPYPITTINKKLFRSLPILSYASIIVSGITSSLFDELYIVGLIGFFATMPYVVLATLSLIYKYKENEGNVGR